MRAGLRMPHEFRDAVFELLRDVMLEDFRLLMDLVLGKPEVLHEVPLEEPVVADDFEGHLEAPLREARPIVGRVLHPTPLRQEPEHLADRRLARAQIRSNPLGSDASPFGREKVDRLDVILDGSGHGEMLTIVQKNCQGLTFGLG